jgi:hypothetical protein
MPFGIPKEVEQRIRARDKLCVYCHKEMIDPYDRNNRNDSATIEHFREEGPFYWNKGLKEQDLSICCGLCNSKRQKLSLSEWFNKPYCIDNKINEDTVAEPVKDFLKRNK